MPQTLAQKIIARAAGRESVTVGEIVVARVDLAMIHDSGGPRRVKPILEHLRTGVWDPERVVVVTDHYVPVFNDETRAIQKLTREWVAAQNIKAFYDQLGICHVVVPEHGHLAPGMFVVGGDSHAPTGGAFGCYMFGIGATEMAGVLATGEIWIKVPDTILIDWSGTLPDLVTAKDMMLHACGQLGMDGGGYQAVQYTGRAVAALNMQDRMTMSNMAAELGGQAGLIAPDETTARYIREAGGPQIDARAWQTDDDAALGAHHRFDASALIPQVAAPHSPANTQPVDHYPATPVDIAYIGACTGAKLSDLRMAAALIKGKTLRAKLLVAPSSKQDQDRAEAEGLMKIFEDAGGSILPNSCGICAGYGADRLGEDVTCISSTARNFQGRMGANSSQVYLGSPYTVAASAITGQITDPREIEVSS